MNICNMPIQLWLKKRCFCPQQCRKHRLRCSIHRSPYTLRGMNLCLSSKVHPGCDSTYRRGVLNEYSLFANGSIYSLELEVYIKPHLKYICMERTTNMVL